MGKDEGEGQSLPIVEREGLEKEPSTSGSGGSVLGAICGGLPQGKD